MVRQPYTTRSGGSREPSKNSPGEFAPSMKSIPYFRFQRAAPFRRRITPLYVRPPEQPKRWGYGRFLSLLQTSRRRHSTAPEDGIARDKVKSRLRNPKLPY